MFPPQRPSSPSQRSPPYFDDQSSAKDRHHKLFQSHYVHDLSTSSHSLATTHSLHDDLPIPSMPTHASHTASAQSTPMTSPSTGYSSLFPGSISSATSESVPNAESKYRSEFGVLMHGSSTAPSPIHGSASSRSSHPLSPRFRSTTEPEPHTSSSRMLYRCPSGHLSNRPGTAPTDSPPPILAISSSVDSSPADHHTRSHSRLTVSIKNLFSRQPGPSPSRFSFNSATTTPPDSEASSSSFHVAAAPGKWSTPRKSRPPDLEISGSVAPAMPSPGRGPNTPVDVHRRYASEAAPKIYNARTGSGLPTSQESLDVSSRNIPMTRGREPKTRNVLRRRPSGSAKLLKGREQGMGGPSPRQHEGDADPLRLPPKEGMSRQGGVAFPLTPAGAVVEAYKQQELHRDDASSLPKLSIDERMSSTASHDGGYDRDHPDHSPTPHYTVFGLSSERRVKAGGPDGRWAGFESHQRIFTSSQVTPLHQPSMSDPGGRSLTRKLSSRWRKVKAGGVVPEESPSCDGGHSKGRPSLQEIWGGDKSTLRLTGQSIDSAPNARDDAMTNPTASHTRLESKGDKGEGPKLWRLMRRISTGGLRDRFQSDKVVPPVPAIPKELLKKANQGERHNDPLSTPRYQPSFSLRDKDQSRTFTTPRNIVVARPSAATSSSSPNSSDVASMQFFKTQSVRSSLSSYGEAVVTLDRHIITPREQLRLGDDHVESSDASMSRVPRSPRRTTSVPAGLRTAEDGEGDHLTLPSPRHQARSGGSPTSGSSTSCSTCPSGSVSARASYQSTGATIGPLRMADGTVSLSPPPRAAKNLPRGGGGSVAGSPSHSTTKHVDGGVGIGGARPMDRTPSSRSDMTARLESPEPGRSQDQDQDAPIPIRRQCTFRELDAPCKAPLTQREKADIWNDLLARSDKAGGTLHINGAAELLSDNMRFSTYSEA